MPSRVIFVLLYQFMRIFCGGSGHTYKKERDEPSLSVYLRKLS